MPEKITIELKSDAAGWFRGAVPADARPFCPTTAGHVHWALREDIHQWLVDRDVWYTIRFKAIDDDNSSLFNYRWLVGLEDVNTALLFKLTFA